MKSGNLNFLEPSGPLQACNGIALPLQARHIGFGCVCVWGEVNRFNQLTDFYETWNESYAFGRHTKIPTIFKK